MLQRVNHDSRKPSKRHPCKAPLGARYPQEQRPPARRFTSDRVEDNITITQVARRFMRGGDDYGILELADRDLGYGIHHGRVETISSSSVTV
jgi:hypothetical protein